MRPFIVDFDEWVILTIRSRSYATISLEQAEQIKATVPNYGNSVVLENEAWTTGWNGEELQQLAPNLVRMWYRKDWQLCDNRVREGRARIAAADAKRASDKAFVLAYFTNKVGAIAANTVVAGLSEDSIRSMAAQFSTEEQQ